MAPAHDLPGFLLAALALTGSPGPATLGLAAAAAAFGLRASLPLLAGIIAGVLAVLLVSAAGLAGLVLAQPLLGSAVTLLALLYMVWLAWRIATAPPLAAGGGGRKPPSFLAGLGLGLGNPKAYAAMAALAAGFALAAGPAQDLALKAVLLTLVMLAVNLAWLLLGAALTRAFRAPRASRALNLAFAALLLASLVLAFAI